MKTIKATHLALAAVLATVAAPITFADDDYRPRGPMSFEAHDLDDDSYVDEHEFDSSHQQRLEQRAAEGRRLRHSYQMAEFSSVDSDGDGKINEREYREHQHERYEQRYGERYEKRYQHTPGHGMGNSAGN